MSLRSDLGKVRGLGSAKNNHGLEAEHDFLRAAVHEHLLQK